MADVKLTAVGEKKIQVIKIVRKYAQVGLKEAKDLVDKADPRTYERMDFVPTVVVATGLSLADARQMIADIESVGGSAEVVAEPYILYVELLRDGDGIFPTFASSEPISGTSTDARVVKVALDGAVIAKLFEPPIIPEVVGEIIAE